MGAVNARTEAALVFDPDPRGWGMFDALKAVGARALNGAEGRLQLGDKGRPEVTWNGYAANPQASPTGLAPLGQHLGSARPVVPTSGELSDQAGLVALSNPALAAFAQRLRDGAGGGAT